ncbi:MAG: MarR family winged helix-turn-helix transcriptional regulator, partial [Solirubrobacteraceae bacterium]
PRDGTGQSDSAVAALSSLYHFLEGPSIDLLGGVLGLTPSGTVRLVDRLHDSGYVTRRPGEDGRTVSLHLTAAGKRAARRATGARAQVLDEAISPLSPDERDVLERTIAKILAGLIRPPGAVRWTCRLCDTTACGRRTGGCPVANRARELYG